MSAAPPSAAAAAGDADADADAVAAADGRSGATLRREVGLGGFLAIGLNISVGGSIFLIGAEAYRLAGSWSLVVALGMGVFALCLGLVVAEVSSRFAGTGGPYVHVRAAFGDFWGFQAGWMMWFTRTLAFATLTNVAITSAAYFLGDGGAILSAVAIFGITAAVAIVHLGGIRESVIVVAGFAVLKVAALLLLIALGGAEGKLTLPQFGPPPPAGQLIALALTLIFSFSGFEVIPVTAGEGRNPRRDVPIATVISVCMMVGLWLALQLVLIATLPGLAGEPRPTVAAAQTLGGTPAAALLAIGAIVAATGTCFGVLLSASRNLFALGADGFAPGWFAMLNRRGAPAAAILFTAAIAAALAFTGSFVYLAAASALPRLFVFFLMCAALIRFRRQDRHGAAPVARFRLPRGATVLAVLLMLVSAGALAGMTASQLLMGAAALAVGAGLRALGMREARRAAVRLNP